MCSQYVFPPNTQSNTTLDHLFVGLVNCAVLFVSLGASICSISCAVQINLSWDCFSYFEFNLFRFVFLSLSLPFSFSLFPSSIALVFCRNLSLHLCCLPSEPHRQYSCIYWKYDFNLSSGLRLFTILKLNTLSVWCMLICVLLACVCIYCTSFASFVLSCWKFLLPMHLFLSLFLLVPLAFHSLYSTLPPCFVYVCDRLLPVFVWLSEQNRENRRKTHFSTKWQDKNISDGRSRKQQQDKKCRSNISPSGAIN